MSNGTLVVSPAGDVPHVESTKSYAILRLRFGETDDQTLAPVEATLFDAYSATQAGIQVTDAVDPNIKRLITAAVGVNRTSEISQLLSGYKCDISNALLVSSFTLYFMLYLNESDWRNIIKPRVANVKTPRRFIRGCLTSVPTNPINLNAFKFIQWSLLIPEYTEADAAITGDKSSALLAQYLVERATEQAVWVGCPVVEYVPKVEPAPVVEPPKPSKTVAASAPVKNKAKPKKEVAKKKASSVPILPTKKKRKRAV